VGVGCGAGVGVGTGVGIGVGAGASVGAGIAVGTAGSATGDPAGDGSAKGVAVGLGIGVGAGVAATGGRAATPPGAGTPSDPCRWIHQRLRAAAPSTSKAAIRRGWWLRDDRRGGVRWAGALREGASEPALSGSGPFRMAFCWAAASWAR
jgi:hypothetical protein